MVNENTDVLSSFAQAPPTDDSAEAAARAAVAVHDSQRRSLSCRYDGCASATRFTCAATYTNPVLSGDHPDPGVLWHDGSYYMATTSGWDASAFPIHKSNDLVSWCVC